MYRIGIDLGGTKIEGVILDADGNEHARCRSDTPARDYPATLEAVALLIEQLRAESPGSNVPVGIGTPGTPSRGTGLMKNCNSTCLNGKPFKDDLEHRINGPVSMANDANCLALSEWHDGAAAGVNNVFAMILGTGVGGGLLINGCIIEGAGGVGGEWGHVPLPWPSAEELPGPECYCGRHGCMEQWCSGPGLEADHERHGRSKLTPPQIVQEMSGGDQEARQTVDRWLDRLARGMSMVCNILDPEVIVVGGGLSRIEAIYEELPGRMAHYIFSDEVAVRIVPAVHGDASGVRGAARLTKD